MNLEKLKPWNWFRHEDDSAGQIPVTRSEASAELQKQTAVSGLSPGLAANSMWQLQREMDRLFDNIWRSIGLPVAGLTNDASPYRDGVFDSRMLGDFRARLDVAGSEKEYEVSIDVPGLSADDIQIELRGNVLTVQGKKETTDESKDKHYYRLERRLGSFQRTLSLPEDADTGGIVAKANNGVLVIMIPRKALPREEAKRITISS